MRQHWAFYCLMPLPRLFSSQFYQCYSKAIVAKTLELLVKATGSVHHGLVKTEDPVAAVTLFKVPSFPLKPTCVTERLIISRVLVTIPPGTRLPRRQIQSTYIPNLDWSSPRDRYESSYGPSWCQQANFAHDPCHESSALNWHPPQ